MFFTALVETNAPRRLDLTIRRNDNPWRARFKLFNRDGSPLDMTAYSAKLQLRLYEGMQGLPNLAVSTPIYSYLIDSQGNRLTFSRGERWVSRDARGNSNVNMTTEGFDIGIDAQDIMFIPPGCAVGEPLRLNYDILVTTPAGDENAWFEGEAIVRDGVSRPLTDRDRDDLNAIAYEFTAGAAA